MLRPGKGSSPPLRATTSAKKGDTKVSECKKKSRSSKTLKRIILTIAATITIVIIVLIDSNHDSNDTFWNSTIKSSTRITTEKIDTLKQPEIDPHDSLDDSNTKAKSKETGGKKSPNQQKREEIIRDSSIISEVRNQIKAIRTEFEELYGGRKETAEMLRRGVQTSGTTDAEKERSLHHTAERIILAALKTSPGSSNGSDDFNGNEDDLRRFTMSFGGYSVTVGRGNHFSQSYPFVLKKILSPIFETLDVDLVIRNSAIGGIPSFPYGWCLPNFLGVDSDVVGWDYGMNEGNGAEALEAYVRQSVASLPKRPMLITLDNKKARVNLLHNYHKNGALLDSIAVGRAEVVQNQLLMDEADRPPGLRKWDEWGSPPGSPGQSKWHPKYMEHQLIAWMMATYFLDAFEIALDMLRSGFEIDNTTHQKLTILPEPVTRIQNRNPDETVPYLLYGRKVDEDNTPVWRIDHISCRTSFLPNIDGHTSSVVVSGVVESSGDNLKSIDDEEYNKGWLSDVGKVERETKRKVEAIGGLGYIDMKLALYGIKASGTLKLWLPHAHEVVPHSHELVSNDAHTRGDAGHWFESLVFCEVNEKRGSKECKMTSDISFVVGGVPASSVIQITDAASYLNKHICVNVKIPSNAKITERKDVELKGYGEWPRQAAMEESDDVGLTVDVTVNSDTVTRKDGACSISHIIWQSI